MKPGYGSWYQRERRRILAGNPRCTYCPDPATTADHVPPLCEAPSPQMWRGVLVPACAPCNLRRGGWRLANSRRRSRRAPAPSRAW